MRIAGERSFSNECRDYGVLGLTIARISRFEHSLDDFIWQATSVCPRVCKSFSKKPPHIFKEKLNFLRHCLINLPQLKRVPLYDDGSINFTALFLMADEIASIRPFLVHGAIFAIRKNDQILRHYSFKKIKVRNKSPIDETALVGVDVLHQIAQNAQALERLLVTYAKVLCEDYDVEKEEKAQREAHDTRKFLKCLGLLPNTMTIESKKIEIEIPVSLVQSVKEEVR